MSEVWYVVWKTMLNINSAARLTWSMLARYRRPDQSIIAFEKVDLGRRHQR